jgi:multidrug efflux pump subunit AcrB
MGAYVAQIMPSLQAVPEIFNISTSVDYTNGRFTYLIDERVTKDLGVNINAFFLMLSAIKNSAYEPNGVKITEFNDFTDDPLEVKAFVLYDDNLADVQVNNVFLDQITRSIRLEPELKSINRVDGLRTITVEADKLSSAPLGVITPQIQQIIKDNPLPP